MRHSEHKVEVVHRQEFLLALLQPFVSVQALTLWTVPVRARVEALAEHTALITDQEMSTEIRGSTLRDGSYHALMKWPMRTEPPPVRVSEFAEDVSQFEIVGAHDRPGLRGEVRGVEPDFVERALHPSNGVGSDLEVDKGGVNGRMSEQLLNVADIGAAFE